MLRRLVVSLIVVALALPVVESSSARQADPSSSSPSVAAATGRWQWLWRYSLGAGPAEAGDWVGQPPSATIACWFVIFDSPTAVDPGAAWTYSFHGFFGDETRSFRYGQPGDRPVCGDWDGGPASDSPWDGPGVVRDGNHWYLRYAPVPSGLPGDTPLGGPANIVFTYGRPGDIPLVGDWDGDGIDTIGVRRGRTFYLRDSLSGGPANRTVVYGRATDIPVVGDWNGDGIDTIGVVRDAVWFLTDALGPSGNRAPFRYGLPTDRPVPANHSGEGTVSGVVRASALPPS